MNDDTRMFLKSLREDDEKLYWTYLNQIKNARKERMLSFLLAGAPKGRCPCGKRSLGRTTSKTEFHNSALNLHVKFCEKLCKELFIDVLRKIELTETIEPHIFDDSQDGGPWRRKFHE